MELVSLSFLPSYNPSSSQMWQVDLRFADVSSLDLRESLYDLFYADFSTKTQWPAPEYLPVLFDYEQIMALGKNPGLGIKKLHNRGITGKGIGIGMIDQTLLTLHSEIIKNLRWYEEDNTVHIDKTATMHGAAVSSIAVGKTTGVAPDASLYYIGSWTGDQTSGGFTFNFSYYARAIRRLLEINTKLPDSQKIKVIAMQIGWNPGQNGYDEIMAACNEAKAQGMLIISSSIELVHGFKFHGLGRYPLADPDKFDSYEPGIFWAPDFYSGYTASDRLLIPMDSRTTACHTGYTDYVFYREGGWSWAIPYIAGMYALAAQVDRDITPEKFWNTALKTGGTITKYTDKGDIPLGPILDPTALIAELEHR
jgi:hypothetical protein